MSNDPRQFEELRSSGLLWLINRTVFHPRGYALALHVDDDDHVVGWSLEGDGAEPYTFREDDERALFRASNNAIKEARNAAFWGREQPEPEGSIHRGRKLDDDS